MQRYCFLWLIGILCLLTGCDLLTKKHQEGVVAEVNGNYLYSTDLASMTVGLNSEDSARVAEEYIRQWVTDILVYEQARDRADKAIESLVEDYRRSLYVHEYEARLVAQRMPTRVADEVIAQFYEEHLDMFVLKESIVKGLLLVVPNDAPKLDQLRKKLNPFQEQALEDVEKYAYQYATGYELFIDEWRRTNDLLIMMPFEQNDLTQQLKTKSQIELKDSISTYILQVVDKYMAGEQMPLDYAKPDIEKVILTQRQVEFLKNERNALYEKKYRK